MDKYFEETVCSQCKNKCKNCVKLRVKQRGNCTYMRCAKYVRKESEKIGEYKIAGYFLYKILRTYYAENEKKLPEDYRLPQ